MIFLALRHATSSMACLAVPCRSYVSRKWHDICKTVIWWEIRVFLSSLKPDMNIFLLLEEFNEILSQELTGLPVSDIFVRF